ncbi:hypothetical protein N9S20_03440 [Candidatus Pelagibacter sp.]|nr:hypothetical protein [Candidatus Pelagibacter sp.]
MFKFLFSFILILSFLATRLFAESFVQFNVSGNDRVSKQAIINFSQLKSGVELSNSDLNNALKNIYETNFFEEVEVNITNNILNIIVKENPIIQDIKFNGVKAKKFVKILKDEIQLKSKSSFNKFTLQQDLNIISNILRQSGYYFAKVDTKLETNQNNTVNIIYEIEMGEKALISEIRFIGDKKFKSSKLQSVIISEEAKFWKFLSSNKYLNKERTELDKRLLKNFYLNKGYYKVRVEDVYTKVLDEQNFSLTYKIESGNRFLFNNFNT